MADKFLVFDNVSQKEKEALVASAGAADAGKVIATNADGKIDPSLMPEGSEPEFQMAKASEALAINDVVNIFDDGGINKARKADATDDTKPAHGYVNKVYALNANAKVMTNGYLGGAALTRGKKYFLAIVPGTVSLVAPVAAGNIIQSIGYSTDANKIKFEADQDYIVRA